MTFEKQSRKSMSTVRRHKLTITRLTRVNEAGFTKVVREPVSEVWGSLDPMSAKQRADYQAISTEVSHFVKVSGKVDLEEKDEIHWNDRVFEVLTAVNVQEIEQEKWVVTKEIRPKGTV